MSPLLHLSVLASQLLTDTDVDPEIEKKLTPGWIGAGVIVGLMLVTVLLWLSMRRQFRKIRFDEHDGDGPVAGDDRSGNRPG